MPTTLLTSPRTTHPDIGPLRAALRAATDGAAEVFPVEPFDTQHWTVQTALPLVGAILITVQGLIDTAAAYTDQRQSQDHIDNWPIELKALVLALIDQLNVIRAALPVPLGAITPAQALAAIRAKASTL